MRRLLGAASPPRGRGVARGDPRDARPRMFGRKTAAEDLAGVRRLPGHRGLSRKAIARSTSSTTASAMPVSLK